MKIASTLYSFTRLAVFIALLNTLNTGAAMAAGNCTQTYSWATWSNFTGTSATASLTLDTQTISMTMTSNFSFGSTPSIYSFNTFSGFAGTIPNSTVPKTTWSAGVGGTTTMCFSQQVNNPILLISSLGSGGVTATLSFSQHYTVLYNGGGMTYSSDTTITGREGYAIIMFPGDFTCVTINSTTFENYTNITWGIHPSPFPVAIAQDTVTCGSLTLTASGGATYRWSGGLQTDSATNIFTQSGTYSVTATDTAGCTASTLKTVDVPFTADGGNDQLVCQNSPATLSATGIGHWAALPGNPSAATITDSTADTTTVTGLSVAGVYQFLWTITAGCIDTVKVTVSSSSVSIAPRRDTICKGQNVTLIATGAPAGGVYSWSPADNSTDTLVVAPDITTTYTISYSINDCVATDSAVVTVIPPVELTMPDVAICRGNSGQITVTPSVSGGTYAWSPGGATTSAITIQPANNTTYTVTYTLNGCSTTDSAVAAVVANPVVGILRTGIACTNQRDTLNTIVNGGLGEITYLWNDLTSASADTVTTTGTYSVVVTDSIGCKGTDTISVSFNGFPTLLHGDTVLICANKPKTLFPGRFANYHWSNGTGFSTLTQDEPGLYKVTVVDFNGCTSQDSAYIAIYPTNQLPAFHDTVWCPGKKLVIGGPTGYASYLWSNSATSDSISISAPGSYSLTATDSHGCIDTATAVVADGSFFISIAVDSNPVNKGDTATLITHASRQGRFSYAWSPGTALNDSTAASPVVIPAATTLYTLTVQDSATLCVFTDTATVVVDSFGVFSFASGFTPNGDTHNDLFGIISTGNVVVKDFKVYNRWGTAVHSDTTPWDGTYKGAEQPAGTYVFTATVEYTDKTGVHTINYKAAFELLR